MTFFTWVVLPFTWLCGCLAKTNKKKKSDYQIITGGGNITRGEGEAVREFVRVCMCVCVHACMCVCPSLKLRP